LIRHRLTDAMSETYVPRQLEIEPDGGPDQGGVGHPSSDSMQDPLLPRDGAQDEAQAWSEDGQQVIRNPSIQEQDPRASTTSS